jgi:hypothetical protein
MLQRETMSLVLFTPRQLLEARALNCNAGFVYMMSVDYRQFFYQIRLPRCLRYFVMKFADEETLCLVALPMGYQLLRDRSVSHLGHDAVPEVGHEPLASRTVKSADSR